MATVVESEEVKTDEEKAVKKVVEEENEPESAGGCDVCLRDRHDRGAVPAPVAARGPRPRRGEGGLPASLLGRRNRLRVLSHAAHISDES